VTTDPAASSRNGYASSAVVAGVVTSRGYPA
jgi:hypothetical protein